LRAKYRRTALALGADDCCVKGQNCGMKVWTIRQTARSSLWPSTDRLLKVWGKKAPHYDWYRQYSQRSSTTGLWSTEIAIDVYRSKVIGLVALTGWKKTR
jgi:hypothetical protein